MSVHAIHSRKIHNTNINKERRRFDTRCKDRVVAGLTGFEHTRIPLACAKLGQWRHDERLPKTKHIRKNKTTRATRLHGFFGSYFLNLSWERLPRVGETRAAQSVWQKRVCGYRNVCSKEKYTRDRSTRMTRLKKDSRNSRINSPIIATGICAFRWTSIYSNRNCIKKKILRGDCLSRSSDM